MYGNPSAIRDKHVNISGGIVNASVMAGADVSNCILNNEVYGNYTLNDDMELTGEEELTIREGASLIIPSEKSLLVANTIVNNGKIVNNGEIINRGTITGKIENNGEIYNMGTLPDGTGGKVYGGKDVSSVNETIDGKADGKIINVNDRMEYRHEDDESFTSINGTEVTGLSAGKYYVRYTATESYSPSKAVEVDIQPGRKLTITLPENQAGYTLSADKTTFSYHESIQLDFALTAGYSETETFAIKSNGNRISPVSGEYNIENPEEDINIVVEGVADITPPEGSITIGTNSWNQFLNSITFGLFFNNTQEVSVVAEDEGSRINAIYYYIANEELTNIELQSLSEWEEYSEAFSINPDNNYVIYGKLCDNAGNTTYISTAGIVLETVAPVISGVENGGVYYTTQNVVATDDNLDSVAVNDELVEGTVVLSGNVDKTYNILAADKAGNTAEIAVTMKPISELSEPIDNLNRKNVKSTDQKVIEEVMAAVAAVDTTDATDAEKAALKGIIDKGSELQKVIDDTRAEIDRINEEKSRYEDRELTDNDRAQIKQLVKDVEKLLASENLTEEERAVLEDAKNSLTELCKDDDEKGENDESGENTDNDEKTSNAEKNSKTGDNIHIGLLIALLTASALGIGGTTIYSRRRTR